MKAIFRVILLTLLAAKPGICDEPVSLFIEGIEISGSELQSEALYGLQHKYEEKIAQLEETIREAKSKQKEMWNEYEIEYLKVLNKKQRQQLESALREEAIFKLKERLEIDSQYLKGMGSILPVIGDATTVELYEGLKRTGMNAFVMAEPDEDTFKVLSHTFYKPKLTLTALDTTTLQGICSDYRSFAGYRGGKFCGGFHPNVLIRFSGPDGQIDMLLCFGCSEALIKTDEKNVMLEIESPAYKKFRELILPLLPHHRK